MSLGGGTAALEEKRSLEERLFFLGTGSGFGTVCGLGSIDSFSQGQYLKGGFLAFAALVNAAVVYTQGKAAIRDYKQ